MYMESLAVQTAPVPMPGLCTGTGAERALDMEALMRGLPMQRRRLKARQFLFLHGQPRHSLYLIHAGCFKTSITSSDGREKITGFRMRGDLLGIEALDMPTHACDALALDAGEVWEVPMEELRAPHFQERLTRLLAAEIRRDWGWMLALGSLSAEQRVGTFLLDFGARLGSLGFDASHLKLHMTRAELGNFLSLQLETIARVLSRMQARGLIEVNRSRIVIRDAVGLRSLVAC